MSKILSKTANKITLISIILSVVLAAAIAVTAIFGVNFSKTISNVNTVTVTGGLFQDSGLETLQEVCEAELEKAGKILYVKDGGRQGADSELVFVFSEDADVTAVAESLKTVLKAKCQDANDKTFYGTIVSVQTGKLTRADGAAIAVSYLVKGIIAVAVFAALAFVYVALRYQLHMGIVAAVATLVGAVVSTAVILLVRIPVNYSVFYAVAVGALLTAVMTLFFFNKVRTNAKENKDAKELVNSSFACKETLGLTAVLGVALVLVGAIATTAVRWFALAAFIALLVATGVALVFAPALYLPIKKAEDKKAAAKTKSGYIGAKKSAGEKEETVAEETAK